MRKQLYSDLQNRLQQITDDNGTALFKHIDLWNQNVEFIEQEIAFDMPAVFIEFLPLKWQTLGGRAQQADLTLRLHIVTRWIAPTHSNSAYQSEALDYLDIPDKVIAALQNFAATQTGNFTRTASAINHNHAEIIDSTEDFTTRIIDASAIPKETYATIGDIKIKPE